jgi:hypothetical protein
MIVMQRKSSDDDEAPHGPYDPDPAEEEDLWFLPPPEEEDALHHAPLPRADRTALIDLRGWRAAQADLAAELAEAAALAGALDERLRAAPDGWRQRLAVNEAAELSWWSGDRIPAERLSLWIGFRLAGVQDDNLALAQAGWAVRRLGGGPAPDDGGWGPGLTAFLGRGTGTDAASADAVADLAEVMAGCAGLHPICGAALLFHTWRMVGTQTASRDIEAAVMAARFAARGGRGGAAFLPLALAGGAGLRATGPVQDRLAAWCRGIEQGALAALLHLERLAEWERRATGTLADLSGKTPPEMIRLMRDWPMISAPMAEQLSSSGRATVQRNLDLMQARGLIREVTGQGRYRVWAARL